VQRFVVRWAEPERLHLEFETTDTAYLEWFGRRKAGLKVL
jgi:hypothetical protein